MRWAHGVAARQDGSLRASRMWAASLDPSLDMVYASTWYPGVDREESAETLTLTGGEDREADFRLNAIAAVHLQVHPSGERTDSVRRTSGSAAGCHDHESERGRAP